MLVFRLLQNGYFSSCLFLTLFILADYEIAQEIKCFRPVERLSSENHYFLVIDTAKADIKYPLKSICNLNQVGRLSVPTEDLFRKEQGDNNFCQGNNPQAFPLRDKIKVGFKCRRVELVDELFWILDS